ncbi:hypothetical protein BGZ58_003434, partial [Dissophora ornata]
MATLALKRSIEIMLSVVSPLLTDDPANNTASAQISDNDNSFWNVRLSRQGDTLTVRMGPVGEGQDHSEFSSNPPPVSCHDNIGERWVARLVPHKNPRLSKTLSVDTETMTCGATIEASKVLHNSQFCFDIVMTLGDESSSSPIDLPKQVEATSKNYDVMHVLLKDIYSVDVCF